MLQALLTMPPSNLGALADNGGPTQTHLPGAGSDAIGAIPNGTSITNNGVTLACNGTTTDQLGEYTPDQCRHSLYKWRGGS